MVQSVYQSKRSTKPAPIARALFYRGLPTRVARKLQVSLSFVCRVIKGQSISARVHKAVRREISLIEKVLHKKAA